jgi:Flp pilus assembly pilin Flp
MSNKLAQTVRGFWDEEDGLGTLEILLIVAVLVIIAIAFRKWIMKWVQSLFTSADTQITNQSGSIQGDASTISP